MDKKILLIEDNEQDRKIMKRTLNNAGYENIIMAETGEEGLQKLKSENPDLVILDVMLPEMDGYKVCDMIKSDQAYKDTPVIMLTGREDINDRKEGIDRGADAYVTKSYKKSDVLLAIMQGLLGG